jgi:hypothetical protein
MILDTVDCEVQLDVEYSIYGKYHAATWNDPAEYPELEIEAVTYKIFDLDGNEIAMTPEYKKLIDEKIDYTTLEEECWYDANQEAE